LAHGAEYFSRLHGELRSLERGDLVWFLDWRGDGDERLAGPGTELAPMLVEAIDRGIDIRGLVWRSHPDQGKLVLIRRRGPAQDVGFVGGIDLCHGRHDDEAHEGDPQAIQINERYGPRPAWHDIQLRIVGPAVADLDTTFRERWDDPTPLDHRNPVRDRIRRMVREPLQASPLPKMPPDPPPSDARTTVQVLRTYPAKRPAYPFARRGERSVARAYRKAFARARSLIYVEDQYLWSREVAEALADALRANPDLRLIAVVPRFPDRDGAISGPLQRVGQLRAMRTVAEAGGDRVLVCDLENEQGRPIYVHAKCCIVDDVWMSVGSDNLNRRSWTHDSELACAVLDERRDDRAPLDPGGLGDRARVLPRSFRLQLWREHLGPAVPADQLLDPVSGFERWRRSAQDLDRWHTEGRRGSRPSGRVRIHRPRSVGLAQTWWALPLYRLVIDPDGRPRSLRRSRSF
jgi:phosphatidylserine/phosphatidylglycerophosphate/cardiolipin synthase-like enzyme